MLGYACMLVVYRSPKSVILLVCYNWWDTASGCFAPTSLSLKALGFLSSARLNRGTANFLFSGACYFSAETGYEKLDTYSTLSVFCTDDALIRGSSSI